jgi:diguanylate cyclase (GGDEF)-like protein
MQFPIVSSRKLILTLAVAAILVSCALSTFFVIAYFGPVFTATVTVGDVFLFNLAMAFIMPLLVTPIIGWRWSRMLGDVTRDYARLDQEAISDPLTGTLNRRGFEAQCRHRRTALGPTGSVALLICDIDHFKRINDTYGHDVGDIAIKQFSAVLRETVGRLDAPIGRLGGEEFGVFLSGIPETHIAAFGNLVRMACEGHPLEIENTRLSFTVSIGIATATGDRFDWAAMMKTADEALYDAKRGGRNAVVVRSIEERQQILENSKALAVG